MTPSASGALAVELHRDSPTHWIATYYPMVITPAGRWADVTWALHQCPMPALTDSFQPGRWIDLRSPDPHHPSYATHQPWSTALAAGYTAALTVYHAEATEEPFSPPQAQQLRAATVMVPPGQLTEWILNDLEEDSTGVHG